MKTLKWIGITVLLAMLTVVAINGSLGDQSSDGKYLYIVQSELERSGSGLTEVADDRKLLPVTDEELTKQVVQLTDQFSVTDKKNNTVNIDLSVNADMYTAENVLDHIVVITNTGNHVGHVRTWFAFEMGDLTEDEFKSSVLLNQNSTQWTWGEFTYGVQIDGIRYAVVCAKYNNALNGGATTAPNLLQILLKSDVSSNTAAIKAFQAGKIENVVINVTETVNKIKGGIVVQEGPDCYVGSIKNVTINAIDTGISLSAPIGEVKNCTIKGAKIGVNAYLYGPYSVTADFINCVIEGADADIYAHDEVGKTNPGSMTVTYDSVMALSLNVVSEIEAEAAGRVFIGIK